MCFFCAKLGPFSPHKEPLNHKEQDVETTPLRSFYYILICGDASFSLYKSNKHIMYFSVGQFGLGEVHLILSHTHSFHQAFLAYISPARNNKP